MFTLYSWRVLKRARFKRGGAHCGSTEGGGALTESLGATAAQPVEWFVHLNVTDRRSIQSPSTSHFPKSVCRLFIRSAVEWKAAHRKFVCCHNYLYFLIGLLDDFTKPCKMVYGAIHAISVNAEQMTPQITRFKKYIYMFVHNDLVSINIPPFRVSTLTCWTRSWIREWRGKENK